MNPHVFGLYGEELKEFRDSLDEAIRQLIVTMSRKDMEEGTVSAKVKIHLAHTVGADGEVIMMLKIEPSVGMKIGTGGNTKLHEENGIFLQFDGEGMPVVGNHQMEIDDYIRDAENGERSA